MCVAIAATVATVATTAYGAYAASSAKDEAAGIPAPRHKGYDAVLAEANPFAGTQDYLQAVNQYGGAANVAANQENDYYRQSVEALAPGTKQGLYLASKNANALLNGDLPASSIAAFQRNSAQAALTGGFGADSGMGRNLTLRDLGRGTADAQQQGLSNLGAVTGLAKSLTPYSAADFLGTQAGYQAGYDSFAQFNATQKNKAAAAAAGVAYDNADAQYAQQVGAALQPNPYAAAASAAAGSFGTGAANLYGRYQAGQNYYGAGNYGSYPYMTQVGNASVVSGTQISPGAASAFGYG